MRLNSSGGGVADTTEIEQDVAALQQANSDLAAQQAAQAALIAAINYGPKGVFSSWTALRDDATANTTEGRKYIYVVTADNKWYYWNGTLWTGGGTFNSTGIADASIARAKLAASFDFVGGLDGSVALANITQSGSYQINTFRTYYATDAAAMGITNYNTHYLTVIVNLNGTKIYFLQDGGTPSGDSPTFIGQKAFNASSVTWKRLRSNRDQPLDGKTLCLMGDSIMALISATTITYRTGMVVTSYAQNGSSVGLRTDQGMAAAWDPWALCTRAKTGQTNTIPIENFQYGLIFMGTNDWMDHGLGTVDSTDEHTTLGAYNVALQNLITRNPTIRLLIATPIPRGTDYTVVNNGSTLGQLSDGIISVAKKWGIPYIDLNSGGLINAYSRGTLMQVDMLHPNAAGADALSNMLAAFIARTY